MVRQKEKIFSVEMLEVDGNHEHHNPILNFICKEKDLENSFNKCDVGKVLNAVIVKTLLSDIESEPMKFINGNCVFIEEINPLKKFNSLDNYYYRINDYNENKAILGGFNDVIDYLKRKIKNKYAMISYNGINEKIEFSEKMVSDILSRMTGNTHVVVLNQLNNRGEESDSIIVTPFKIIKENNIHK